MSMTIERRVQVWLLSDDTGSSSKDLCRHMIGINKKHASYPSDPSDLGRCLRLLDFIPEWKDRINEMATYGCGWNGLVSEWDIITQTFNEECKAGSRAPKTYELMKSKIAFGYMEDKRYECTFSSEGHLQSARKVVG